MSTFHHQKRFSVSSMASAFEVIKEASPEKAASPGIANQTTRYRNTLSTASLLSSGVPYTTNYNPSRAYPRPRLVLPLISRSRRGSLPSAHNSSPLETGVHGSSYALGLYSSPTAAQSYITASVSTNDLSQSSRKSPRKSETADPWQYLRALFQNNSLC
ncbi:hypothetical protein B0O99DRAFT_31879 [Bisporella sp. PMI_857]|nr:hypothetical protein B0O99DRAFT_31879 [Bisporella sp. PMI_857]